MKNTPYHFMLAFSRTAQSRGNTALEVQLDDNTITPRMDDNQEGLTKTHSTAQVSLQQRALPICVSMGILCTLVSASEA